MQTFFALSSKLGQLLARSKAALSSAASKVPVSLRGPLLVSGAVLVLIGLMLLSLLSIGGCAASMPVVPPTRVCPVPEASLQPTPAPQMEDATGKELLLENQKVRAALEACNGDKADALQFLKERENGKSSSLR